MKTLLTIFWAFSMGMALAQAEGTAPPTIATPVKKNYNANIYEKESAGGLSAKVKTTKTSREDTLVYFEGLKKSGPYVLSSTVKNYTKLKNRLVKSSESGGPKVSVTLDDQDNILTVEVSEETETADSPKS